MVWLGFVWQNLKIQSWTVFICNKYLDADDVDKLFFESSGPLEGVLFGIIDLPKFWKNWKIKLKFWKNKKIYFSNFDFTRWWRFPGHRGRCFSFTGYGRFFLERCFSVWRRTLKYRRFFSCHSFTDYSTIWRFTSVSPKIKWQIKFIWNYRK